MATSNYGKPGPVHQVKYDPKKDRNDVFFGPKGMKPGHAVIKGQSGKVEYLRGAGKNVKPTIDTKKYL